MAGQRPKRLGRDGARTVAVGRNERALAEVVSAISAAGGQAIACRADVTADEAPAAIVGRAVDAFGGLDACWSTRLESSRLARSKPRPTTVWDSMMAINLRAPFRLMRAAAPHLAARKGAIVNVSSVNGLRSFAGVLAHNVSKAGVDHLTRCAALELAPLGVRVNAVNPGVTVTNLHRRSGMEDAQYTAFLERSKTTHPLGRPGTRRRSRR